jgi:calreticulin
MKSVLLIALICGVAFGHIYYQETFDAGMDNWVQSAKKSDYGKFVLSSGDFYGDKKINQGIKTSQDAKFYAISAPVGTITNENKDLVVSMQVKHEQGIDCGGGYIKLLSNLEPKELHGDSEYWMMFGPDVCGYTRKVHLIINYKGTNHLWKKEPRVPDDKFTHVYTVVIHPDNTYEFYLDEEKKESGKIEDDWSILKPKQIDDPSDSKPSDWVDQAQMDDPDDKKPEDWDNEPDTIPDPDAKQPEDWDESEDGKWEPPTIQNPKAKGEWHPKRIPNPKYKGVWKAKQIPNPEYVDDKNLYQTPKPLTHVAIDVWQVKSGTIFDNIIIGDNLEEVNAIVEKTWKATKDAEKKAHDDKNKSEEKKEDEHAGHDHEEDKEEL